MGEILRLWRLSQGISQKELAVLLDCTDIYVSSMEHGWTVVTPEDLNAYADALGTTVAAIISVHERARAGVWGYRQILLAIMESDARAGV